MTIDSGARRDQHKSGSSLRLSNSTSDFVNATSGRSRRTVFARGYTCSAAKSFNVRNPRHWGVLILIAVVLYLCFSFWLYRVTHSITDDAFVEAHIVNIAPQNVSGHFVRFLVEVNDRVENDQVLAEIDPVPYRDQVDVARKKVAEAEAELKRQEAALERLRIEVPIQIAIAQHSLGAAKADAGRAKESLKLTEDEVEHGIEEAKALVDAADADLTLAQQEYTRYTNLQSQNVVPLKRAQEVTQARDAAEARQKLAVTKLATAKAEKAKIEAARLTLEAAGDSSQKAEKGVDLAETGSAQIREVELLTAVKKAAVDAARALLASAEVQLKFTRIRAPFPGVIVKAYRHLGDFASVGVPILSMYNPDQLYVSANLEETRLQGVAPGVPVELHLDAFDKPFHGRVLWINKSTGARVRFVATQCCVRRIHQGRAARAGADCYRKGRALAPIALGFRFMQ